MSCSARPFLLSPSFASCFWVSLSSVLSSVDKKHALAGLHAHMQNCLHHIWQTTWDDLDGELCLSFSTILSSHYFGVKWEQASPGHKTAREWTVQLLLSFWNGRLRIKIKLKRLTCLLKIKETLGKPRNRLLC